MDDSRASALEAFSSLIVQRGMFVLRYVSATDTWGCPSAEIHIPADLDKKVKLISPPGAPVGRLERPGSCVVVVAEAPTTLTIGLRSGRPGGSLEAVIRLERLDTEGQPESGGKTSEPPAPVSRSASVSETLPEVELVAHVSRRGDVEVAPGSWAAGPDAPAAIEGLVAHVAAEAGVSVQIQALLGLRNSSWTEWGDGGAFIGTRGRAQPITGLRLRLVGPKSAAFSLVVDAMFLGSQNMTLTGKLIEVASAFGADPLVGLRVKIERNEKVGDDGPVGDKGGASGSKIRIFRAPQRR